MEIKTIQAPRPNIIVVIIYLTLSLGIIIAGFLFYQRQRTRIEDNINNQLLSISHYKAEHISNWLSNHIRSAEIISTSFPINNLLKEFIVNPSNRNAKQSVDGIMDSYRRCYDYESIILINKKGSLLISIPTTNAETHQFDIVKNKESLRSKKVILSDLHKNEVNGKIGLNVYIPLLSVSKRDTTILGTLICSIDPHKFLYPLIITWPVKNFSAESFIVRHEGNNLLYLSELRFIRNAALTFSRPDTDKNLPAAMAADGREGIVEGEDYRGMNVLAAITRIKHTPWFLVSKQDTDEIYEPLRKSSFIVSSVIFLLLVIAGFSTAFYLRKNNLTFYKELYKKELEKNILMKHLDYLIRYANDIILLLNPNGAIVEANNKAVATYGYEKDELTGKDIKKLIADVEQKSVIELMTEIEESGGLIVESMHKKKDGTTFPVEISARVIEIDKTKYYQGIIRDITERKEHEEKLSIALERAEKSDKLKSEFLSQMSHEVRTPLNAVLNYAGLIKSEFEDKLTEDYLEIFRGLEQEGERITRTIDEILNLSQLIARTFDLKITEINLVQDIITPLVEEFLPTAKSKNIELRLNNLVVSSIVKVDRYSVEQIFSNLIDNAIKYTNRGFVKIRVLNEAGGVIVEVEDSGIGISDEFIPKIFEPFTQEDRGYSRRFEGNGLGLALVKKFCEVNCAMIEVKSKKNVGSIFRVKFNAKEKLV